MIIMRYLATAVAVLMIAHFSLAADYSVGVSPPVVDLGELRPGSSQIVRFFLVTPSDEPLVVMLNWGSGSLEFFNKAQYSGLKYNYSEQQTQAWAEFFSNPVELLPTAQPGGFGIRGGREINFVLTVPEDAEPGYHIIDVAPSPIIPQEDIGETGAAVVAVASVNVIFNVAGPAVRDGNIFDVVHRNGFLETYFKNTGTVTMKTRALHRIYDLQNNTLEIASPTEPALPGELHILAVPFQVAAGEYTVETVVDYTTGYDEFSTSVISSGPAAPQQPLPKEEFPLWVVIAILIIAISIVIYRRIS